MFCEIYLLLGSFWYFGKLMKKCKKLKLFQTLLAFWNFQNSESFLTFWNFQKIETFKILKLFWQFQIWNFLLTLWNFQNFETFSDIMKFLKFWNFFGILKFFGTLNFWLQILDFNIIFPIWKFRKKLIWDFWEL